MNWFCCSHEHSRKIYPEYSYNWYIPNDHPQPNSNSNPNLNKGPTYEKLQKCQATKNPYEYENYARIKIKSKNVEEIVSNIRSGRGYFIDEDFPHVYANVRRDEMDSGEIQWKKVGELVPKAVYSLPAIEQQYLSTYKSSNKALQTCLTLISRTHPKKLQRIRTHTLTSEGLYQFKLFKAGIIHNIIIDDFVPSFKGHHIFTGPANDREVYPMLLEKAIAKICGGYDRISGNALDVMEMIYCGAIRRENLDDLRNLGQFRELVIKTLGKDGLTILLAKDDKRVRQYGINSSEIYHIINQHPITLPNGQQHTLYEILSENKMSAWNGSFRITDPTWQQLPQPQRNKITKAIQTNHSFTVLDKEIYRIFDRLIVYEDTETMNKDWLESYSESGYPSFCRFRLKSKDSVFLRITTRETIRQSLILCRVVHGNLYQLVGGAFDDCSEFLECHFELEAGDYVICVLQEWVLKKEGEYVVYLSSTCRTVLVSEIKPIQNFLELMFTDHQARNNTQENSIFYQCLKQIGLGYLKVWVRPPTQIRKIQVNFNKIKSEEWEIMEPFNDMKQIVTTSTVLLIMKMLKNKPKELSNFPIEAFIVGKE